MYKLRIMKKNVLSQMHTSFYQKTTGSYKTTYINKIDRRIILVRYTPGPKRP